MVLLLWAWIEKTVQIRVEKYWLSNKENVLDIIVSKEEYAEIFLGLEKTHYYWYLEKSATVNSASYCQLLRHYFSLFIELPLYIHNLKV